MTDPRVAAPIVATTSSSKHEVRSTLLKKVPVIRPALIARERAADREKSAGPQGRLTAAARSDASGDARPPQLLVHDRIAERGRLTGRSVEHAPWRGPRGSRMPGARSTASGRPRPRRGRAAPPRTAARSLRLAPSRAGRSAAGTPVSSSARTSRAWGGTQHHLDRLAAPGDRSARPRRPRPSPTRAALSRTGRARPRGRASAAGPARPPGPARRVDRRLPRPCPRRTPPSRSGHRRRGGCRPPARHRAPRRWPRLRARPRRAARSPRGRARGRGARRTGAGSRPGPPTPWPPRGRGATPAGVPACRQRRARRQ